VKPSSLAPERILAFGSPGSGKSKGWGDIAQMYRVTGTTGHFHVLSTEDQTSRVRDAYPPSETDPGWDANVTVHECRDWPGLEAATKTVLAAVTGDDWVIIDELGKPWEWVSQYYDDTRPKKRAVSDDPFALEDGPKRDAEAWVAIKKVYYRWLNGIMLDRPWHVYACAHEDALRVEGGWKDSDDAVNVFKYIGYRAVTEKTAPYMLKSVLWCRRTARDKWVITTVKDPARDYLHDQPVLTFPATYLLSVAGWDL
jgi:hypothetical protein